MTPRTAPEAPLLHPANDESLTPAELRLRLVTDALQGYVYEYDVETGRVDRSAGFSDVTGWTTPEAKPSADWWISLVHPDDLQAALAEFESVRTDPSVSHIERRYRIRHRDGRWIWISDRQRFLRQADGRLQGIAGVAYDVSAHVAAEEALREHEAVIARQLGELEAIYRDAPVGLAVFDRELRFVRLNDRLAHITGSPIADHIGRTLREVAPDISDVANASLRRVLETGAPLRDVLVSGETPAQPGRTRDWIAQLFPLRGADGEMLGVNVVVEEVTERRHAEEERERLLRAEREARSRTERLQALTAALGAARTSAQVAHVTLDEGALAMGIPRCAVALLDAKGENFTPNAPGLPAGDAVATRAPVVVRRRADYVARYPALADSTRDAGERGRIIFPLLAGPAPEDAVLGVLAFDVEEDRVFDDGEMAFLVALATVSAQALVRVRLDEAERAARARAEGLQALAAALALAATPREVIAAAVAQGAAATGTTFGLLSLLDDDGAWFTIVEGPNMSEDMVADWRRFPNEGDIPAAVAVRTGAPCYSRTREEYAARAPGLREIAKRNDLHAEAALPLRVDDRTLGVISFGFTTSRDFTAEDDAFLRAMASLCAQSLERARLFEAERTARAAAEDASRAKSDFLAVMSHELRTPLNAIAGYAELLEMGIHGSVTPQQRDDVSRIQRSQRHLLALINEVLSYARVEAGTIQYDIQPVLVADAIELCNALTEPLVRERGLELELCSSYREFRVHADPDRLQQILLNLLGNAIKFTEPGGRISLTCDADDSQVRIRVSDTGQGIDAAQLDRIFEPFVQADRRRSRANDGLGLGLAISRDLARGMRGDLSAESVPGTGSTFTLRLPKA